MRVVSAPEELSYGNVELGPQERTVILKGLNPQNAGLLECL